MILKKVEIVRKILEQGLEFRASAYLRDSITASISSTVVIS